MSAWSCLAIQSVVERGEKHGTTHNHQNFYLEIQYGLGKASYKIMVSKPGNMLKLQFVYTIVSLILERGYTCINIQNKCSCLDDSDFHYTCIKKLVNNSARSKFEPCCTGERSGLWASHNKLLDRLN